MNQVQLAARARGFSMVELLVALVILGIITAIAVPTYSQYLVRGQRSAAKAVLLQTAQAMERYYTACGSYSNTNANNPCTGNPTVSYPLGSSYVTGTTCNAVSPPSPATVTYCVTGAASSVTGYTLYATPCGDAGTNCGPGGNSSFSDPQCDILTIDNTGLRGALNNAASAAVAAACWQQ